MNMSNGMTVLQNSRPANNGGMSPVMPGFDTANNGGSPNGRFYNRGSNGGNDKVEIVLNNSQGAAAAGGRQGGAGQPGFGKQTVTISR